MRRRLRPLRARSTVAHLCALAVCAALGRGTLAADLYYLGAQYTPGLTYPAPWPTEGSWADQNLWQNNTLPTSSTNAIFGYDQPMPNGNTTHAPHTLHFGTFGYFGTTTIGDIYATVGTITLLKDNWTFDFAGGQNPDFTGTLTAYNGTLTVSTLSLAPSTGQSTSLMPLNGTLNVSSIKLGSAGGQALLAIGTGATVKASASTTIGITGSGTIVQTAGVHSLTSTSGALLLGYNAGATGIYSLSGGWVAVDSLAIGYSGGGTFTQTGGSITLTYGTSNSLYLGYNPGAVGSYALSGGVLYPPRVYVGYSGTGIFNQINGTCSASVAVYLGYNAGATGVYNLDDGQLAIGTGAIGYSGAGAFSQTNGTNTISGTLNLGVNAAASGTYSQSGGKVSAPQEYLGYSGAGTFTQSGGTHTVTTLTLGHNAGATGTFVLSNGYLSGVKQQIGLSGTGTFTQTGGTNNLSSGSNTLYLGYNAGSVGSYSLDGGQLTVPLPYVGYSGTGIFNQTNGTHSISGTLYLGYNATASGTYTLSNSGQLTTPSELLGYMGQGVFAQDGGTHTLSSLLYIGVIENRGSGTYSLSNGQLTCPIVTVGRGGAGTFTQTGGTQSLGALIASDGSLATASYNLAGGQLAVSTAEYIGNSGLASFSQTGGANTISGTLCLGVNSRSAGTYTLSDGLLSTPREFIGYNGVGRFVQNGGTHTITGAGDPPQFYIGYFHGSEASSYELNGGQLTCTAEYIGCASCLAASFTQTGGSHTVTGSLGLHLGDATGGRSSYSLSGGQLTTTQEYLGRAGGGTFTQTGGTHTVSGTLTFGAGSSGLAPGYYLLSNGILTTFAENPSTFSTFIQTGGTHTVSSYLPLNGSYTLSNGYMSTVNEDEWGVFTQTGGTHSVSGSLAMGPRAFYASTYALSSGVLTTATVSLSSAVFTQTGGTHTVSNYLAIGVGDLAASYSLSNTAMLSTPSLYLGGNASSHTNMGFGGLSISGGTVTVTDTLKIWPDYRTRLNLSGGTLTAGSFVVVNAAYGNFAWTAGTLIITGPTAPALTVPTAGTFLGAPTIAGSLTNNGLLSPGQSPGLLTVQGDFTQSDSATLLLEIAGTALADFDRLSIPGTGTLPGNVRLAGTLDITFLPAYTPHLGDTFDFLDWTGTFTNSGYSFNFTHASLPDGLAWDTSKFSTTGQLTIIAAPEPTSLILLSLGALSLLRKRQRVPRLRRTQLVPCRRRTEP